MAFLWIKPNSKYWQAGFYDKDKKRRNRSTGLPAKAGYRKQAQRIADQFEEAGLLHRSARKVRDTILELHKEITNEELPVTTLRSHCKAWLARKKPEVATSSYTSYKSLVNSFISFLGERADQDINNITRQTVTDFRNKMAEEVSATTTNNRIKSLRSIFKEAEKDGYLSENPALHVERIKQKSEKVEKSPFTIDELKSILAIATPEWKSMILFGLYTGQRLGDIASLDWSNIDLEQQVLTMVTAKTKTRLRIPIAGPLLDHIAQLPSSSKTNTKVHPIAAERLQNADGKTSTISNQFTKMLENVGLREKTTHSSKNKGRNTARKVHPLSFHSLRHTAVSMLHASGIPAATVQALIGHDSDAVHQLYTHVDQTALRRATAALPELK